MAWILAFATGHKNTVHHAQPWANRSCGPLVIGVACLLCGYKTTGTFCGASTIGRGTIGRVDNWARGQLCAPNSSVTAFSIGISVSTQLKQICRLMRLLIAAEHGVIAVFPPRYSDYRAHRYCGLPISVKPAIDMNVVSAK